MDNNNNKIDLQTYLEMSRERLDLSKEQFAKYLGVARAWLFRMYCPNKENTYIKPETMAKLIDKIDAPISLLEEHNRQIVYSILAKGKK